MAPVLFSTTAAAAAAAATAGHRLAARGVSQGAIAGIALGAISAIWVGYLLFWVARGYLDDHRHGRSRRRQMMTVATSLFEFVVYALFFWVVIPFHLYCKFIERRDRKRQSAAAAAATNRVAAARIATAAAAATAARTAPATTTAVEPPPLARPTMPMEPVELAPEEPDLGDPDDIAALRQHAGPPGADGTDGIEAAAAPQTEPPAYQAVDSTPAPAYQPAAPAQG